MRTVEWFHGRWLCVFVLSFLVVHAKADPLWVVRNIAVLQDPPTAGIPFQVTYFISGISVSTTRVSVSGNEVELQPSPGHLPWPVPVGVTATVPGLSTGQYTIKVTLHDDLFGPPVTVLASRLVTVSAFPVPVVGKTGLILLFVLLGTAGLLVFRRA